MIPSEEIEKILELITPQNVNSSSGSIIYKAFFKDDIIEAIKQTDQYHEQHSISKERIRELIEEKEDEAMRFAEWLASERYYNEACLTPAPGWCHSNKWFKGGSSPDHRETFTTNQLFIKFKADRKDETRS